MSTENEKMVRVSAMVPPDLWLRLEDERRRHTPILSQSDAVRLALDGYLPPADTREEAACG